MLFQSSEYSPLDCASDESISEHIVQYHEHVLWICAFPLYSAVLFIHSLLLSINLSDWIIRYEMYPGWIWQHG